MRDGEMKERGTFQSTSPVWRTTSFGKPEIVDYPISIHVPRVEDDTCTNRI